ncbi:hypothetical protein V8F33_012523 [Rhypophila sp. PSN 637]
MTGLARFSCCSAWWALARGVEEACNELQVEWDLSADSMSSSDADASALEPIVMGAGISFHERRNLVPSINLSASIPPFQLNRNALHPYWCGSSHCRTQPDGPASGIYPKNWPAPHHQAGSLGLASACVAVGRTQSTVVVDKMSPKFAIVVCVWAMSGRLFSLMQSCDRCCRRHDGWTISGHFLIQCLPQRKRKALIDRLELLTLDFQAYHEAKEQIPRSEDDLYKELEYKQVALRDAIDDSLASFSIGEDRPFLSLAEEVVVPDDFYDQFAKHPVQAVEHDLGALIDYTFAPPLPETLGNEDARQKQRRFLEVAADESPELFIFLSFTRFHTKPEIRLTDAFYDFGYCDFAILQAKRFLARTAEERPRGWIFHKNIQLVIAKRANEPRFVEFRKGNASPSVAFKSGNYF